MSHTLSLTVRPDELKRDFDKLRGFLPDGIWEILNEAIHTNVLFSEYELTDPQFHISRDVSGEHVNWSAAICDERLYVKLFAEGQKTRVILWDDNGDEQVWVITP